MDQQASQTGLVNGLKNADVEAWRGLYAQCGAAIQRLTRGMVGADDADDLAQEAFLQAFRKRQQFRGESAKELEAWLYRIAVNKCRDWCRSRRGKPAFVAVSDWSALAVETAPIENHLDDADLLEEGLQGVKPALRALLLLHLAGKSYREIGKIMKIKSKGTVSVQLGRAREQLRRALARLGWSEET